MRWSGTRCCGTTTARAPDAIDLIAELGGPQAWADQVGSVPPASFTVTKLRWLARAEPENAARTASVLLPHDWLTWELGGRRSDPATDRGDASGTGYFDATANAYRDDLVRLALGHDLRLPTVAAPDAVVGETADGIRLAPGTGDNMAAGLGLGLTPGTAVVSLGTSGTAFTTSATQSHDPTGTVAGFADATGAFLPLVCTLNAARNLSATASLLDVDFTEFARLALTAPAGSGGLAFVPYLEGERTPPLPTATGELVGMSLANLVPANLARAAIEGILWSLAFGLRVLQQHGDPIERVILTGGAAQSAAVQQIAPRGVRAAGHRDRRGRERGGRRCPAGGLGADRSAARLAGAAGPDHRGHRGRPGRRDHDRRALLHVRPRPLRRARLTLTTRLREGRATSVSCCSAYQTAVASARCSASRQ